MSDQPHQCFTASETAYMRTLSRQVLSERCVAIHYQAALENVEGGQIISLRFPFLILAHYVENIDAEAEKVARILNACWDDPRFADPSEGAQA